MDLTTCAHQTLTIHVNWDGALTTPDTDVSWGSYKAPDTTDLQPTLRSSDSTTYYFGFMKGPKKYQDVLRRPVRFGSMRPSALLWRFWPTILCAAEYTTRRPTSPCMTWIKTFRVAFFGWMRQNFPSFRLEGQSAIWRQSSMSQMCAHCMQTH